MRKEAKIGRAVDGVGNEVLDADASREDTSNSQQLIADRAIPVNRFLGRLFALFVQLGFVLRGFCACVVRLFDALLEGRAIQAKRDNQCINDGSGHLLGYLVGEALVMGINC